MSTIVLAACWPLQIPPTPKAVLISLADNANDQGVCWPSLDTIQMRTCFGRSAVIEAIKWLEGAGLVVADRSNGRKTSYQVVPNGRTPQLFDGLGNPAKQSGKQTGSANKPVRQTNRFGRQTGSADGQNQSGSRTEPVREPDTNRHEPSGTSLTDARTRATAAGALASGVIAKLGLTCGITAIHPKVLEAVELGITAEQVLAVHAGCNGKSAVYALSAAINQVQEARARAGPAGGAQDPAASPSGSGASHAASQQPRRESVAERVRRLAREGEQRDAESAAASAAVPDAVGSDG